MPILPTIIVHGGAFDIPDALVEPCRLGCQAAAAAGLTILRNGGNAVDAVERAIQVLEDNPVFDAGIGSCLTQSGTVEMDAMIMRGDTLDIGAVACVSTPRHPISAARLVLETSPHVLLVGPGADAFIKKGGLEQATQAQLVTDIARQEYEQYKQYGTCVSNVFAAGGGEQPRHGRVRGPGRQRPVGQWYFNGWDYCKIAGSSRGLPDHWQWWHGGQRRGCRVHDRPWRKYIESEFGDTSVGHQTRQSRWHVATSRRASIGVHAHKGQGARWGDFHWEGRGSGDCVYDEKNVLGTSKFGWVGSIRVLKKRTSSSSLWMHVMNATSASRP